MALKAAREKQIIYKRTVIRLIDFSTAQMKSQKRNNIFKRQKENSHQASDLDPVKLSFTQILEVFTTKKNLM